MISFLCGGAVTPQAPAGGRRGAVRIRVARTVRLRASRPLVTTWHGTDGGAGTHGTHQHGVAYKNLKKWPVVMGPRRRAQSSARRHRPTVHARAAVATVAAAVNRSGKRGRKFTRRRGGAAKSRGLAARASHQLDARRLLARAEACARRARARRHALRQNLIEGEGRDDRTITPRKNDAEGVHVRSTRQRQQTTGSHPARVLRSCFAGGRRASNESDSYLPPQRKPSYLPTPATPPLPTCACESTEANPQPP